MTSRTQQRSAWSRFAIAGAFVLAGLAGSAHGAIAGPPLEDTGGPGGGSATADASRPIYLEHFGLVPTNDGPTSFSMNGDGPTLVGSDQERETVAVGEDVPVLVGSGADRETVASTTASGTLDETARSNDLIAMSGGTTTASGTLDESARSQDLITLSPSATTDVAAAHRGQPY